MAPPETMGERLAKAQKAAKLTNRELAARTGASEQTVSLWRHSKQRPQEALLARVAEALGVSVAWLRYGIEDVPTVRGETPAEVLAPTYSEGVKEGLRRARAVIDALLKEMGG